MKRPATSPPLSSSRSRRSVPDYALFVLEEYAERPLTDMPREILDDLATSQVSIFCAQTQRGELGSRMEMSDVVNKNHIRHGHMVNINRQIMREGMRADFMAIDALSQRLVERVRRAKRVTCRTPAGTDYSADLSSNLRWLKTSGIITPEKWGNLPGGEIFTSPFDSNGIFVVDGVVGDYLCQKYGDIQATPLTIEVKRNRIHSLACENKELLEEFAPTPTPTKTATGWANSRSGPIPPAPASSATSCRTKKSRGSISPLAIPTPSIPARPGFPRRTSTASAAISTSGSTTNR